MRVLWAIVEDNMNALEKEFDDGIEDDDGGTRTREHYELDKATVDEILEACVWHEENDCYTVNFLLNFDSLKVFNVDVATLSSTFKCDDHYVCEVSTKILIETINRIKHNKEDYCMHISILIDEYKDFFLNLWEEDLLMENLND